MPGSPAGLQGHTQGRVNSQSGGVTMHMSGLRGQHSSAATAPDTGSGRPPRTAGAHQWSGLVAQYCGPLVQCGPSDDTARFSRRHGVQQFSVLHSHGPTAANAVGCLAVRPSAALVAQCCSPLIGMD